MQLLGLIKKTKEKKWFKIFLIVKRINYRLMNKLYYKNHNFKITANGHGGDNRTAQITELVNSTELEIIEKENTLIANSRLSRYSNGIKFLITNKFKIPPSYKVISQYGHYYKTKKDFFKKHNNIHLVLWEDTQNPIVPYLAREQQAKLIALPQNLESFLVEEQSSSYYVNKLLQNFSKEIEYLTKSDAIFCISREEQWLLNLLGINADFLPYYPPSNRLSSLLQLRKLRTYQSHNKRFLILGTCNKPTYLGMIEQIQWLNQLLQNMDFEVDIAGYGTEKLKNYCQNSKFNLLGTVDSDQLERLLINAKALLIHQKAGVGALTRIPETIIAG
ncbi:MAG: glycosyltransferase family 4 protein, partial [Hydrococcus sp. SU_1_0]|nr:glycosyltransferase family 4 protein [Hydrococcus sp. SU_1_0]